MLRRISLNLIVALFAGVGLVNASTIKNGEVESRILGVTKPYAVYLPDGYENSGMEYPVLYLLHGASDTFRAWVEKGSVQTIADQEIRAGFALPMIIVMPDARGVEPNNMGKNMGYFNMLDWSYEDFFFQEFIPFIEKTYRISKDKGSRAIAGLSMGGGGTTVYAMRHPEMFSSACPLSGLVGGFENMPQEGLWKDAAPHSPILILDNATPEKLDAIRSVRWYVDCGDDDFLLDGNIELFQKMREKKIPVQFRIRDGVHNWLYWQQGLQEVLKYVSIGFAK
jgi:enterochelin esterase-like enzyme